MTPSSKQILEVEINLSDITFIVVRATLIIPSNSNALLVPNFGKLVFCNSWNILWDMLSQACGTQWPDFVRFGIEAPEASPLSGPCVEVSPDNDGWSRACANTSSCNTRFYFMPVVWGEGGG